MTTNFKVIDNIAIEDLSNYFDLHNNYDLKKIEIKNNEIFIFFERVKEDWTKNEPYDILQISHKNVDFYSLESLNKNSEKSSLASISFRPKDDFNVDTIFLKDTPDDNDEIIYVLEDDSYIRISCNDISLSYFKL